MSFFCSSNPYCYHNWVFAAWDICTHKKTTFFTSPTPLYWIENLGQLSWTFSLWWYVYKHLLKRLYMMNTEGGADCRVISSVSMIPCIWFHCGKQLSKRLAFYFNDFAFFFWKNVLCISIGSYKFFLNADAMATSFSFEIIKPFFAQDVDVSIR